MLTITFADRITKLGMDFSTSQISIALSQQSFSLQAFAFQNAQW